MEFVTTLKYKLLGVYTFFRHDIPRFVKNIWRFRKALYHHYWFDHHGVFMFMEIGLTHMADEMEMKGLEVPESRMKKVEKMRRAVQLIRNYNESNHIEQAEAQLGELIMHPWEFKPSETRPGSFELVDKDTPEEKEHNNKVFKLSREIEEKEWNELFDILKGQDYSKFVKDKEFDTQFDGTGIRGWWD
jgi:hypothetical protein